MRECQFDCKYFNKPQIDGRCPVSGELTKEQAADFCRSVYEGRRATAGINSAPKLKLRDAVHSGLKLRTDQPNRS